MEILLNGDANQVADGCTLTGLLESLSIDPSRVAVELDGAIVQKDRWSGTVLVAGSKVEVVMFVGGG